LIAAIKKNHFTTWPGLTVKAVKKHLPPCVATAKGHLNQEMQGLQSTKKIEDDPEDLFPTTQPSEQVKNNDVIYALISHADTKSYMDLSGRFPHCSSRGNEYIMIAYHYDANAILGVPVKNRQAAVLTKAWKEIHHKLCSAGLKPTTWILDNETSHDLQTAMTKYKTKYQLVPPHIHRANAAERAIQTFKNHFKAGLASLDPDFPMAGWDRLL
jgi:hypothetical protein